MPGPSVPHIAAAAALAASVTLGGSTAPGAKAASGYALNRGSEDTFDVDRIQDEAQQLQVLSTATRVSPTTASSTQHALAQVLPITVIKTDYKLQFLRQISSTATYICYGLKLGHIRALNKANANRALLKGHSTMIVDLQFQSPTSGLLASCDQAGNLFVRRLYDHEAEKVEEEVLVQHSLSGSKSGTYHLAWHPSSEALLAVTEGDRVSLVSVPLTAALA
ncbi:uncharacterized protein HaLaN_22893 [Haematococcus lacustris]|uniref:Enhancer of mRNA-decapping protein 4 WD40 repeat region domain-containing protein n=1 Tax=Haematococcus lacustris TaxID=44745 RepID=A0A6A0A0V3_HAELA|nr:uncharacterized protein HaLaN_22893 [Haematococcus lacustris]